MAAGAVRPACQTECNIEVPKSAIQASKNAFHRGEKQHVGIGVEEPCDALAPTEIPQDKPATNASAGEFCRVARHVDVGFEEARHIGAVLGDVIAFGLR